MWDGGGFAEGRVNSQTNNSRGGELSGGTLSRPPLEFIVSRYGSLSRCGPEVYRAI